jgi:pimeloyl-ACP methyl ester carboxylesterase
MFWIVILITLLLGLFLTFLFFLRKNNIKSIQETRTLCETSSSAYLRFNNLDCHYTDQGSGETIVLIHGLGDSFKIFDKFAQELAKNYRVLSVDLPGFGLSDVPRHDLEMTDLSLFYRNFLTCFVEELKLTQFHLFGNSLGGWVSWDWTTYNNDKVKSLCLLASAGFEMDLVKKNITKGVLELIPRSLLKRGMPSYVSGLNAKETLYQRNYRTREHILTNYRMINKKGTLSFMFNLLTSTFSPDIEHVNKVQVPTLIVWGEKDRIIPSRHADLFQQSIANSKKIIYPKCGHYPQIEFCDELIQDWTSFTN